MATGANKYAPFLLQKRWQEQDRQRDNRVQTLRGTQAFKPDFKKGPKAQSSFLTSNEYTSAYAPRPLLPSGPAAVPLGQPITIPARPPWQDDFPHKASNCSFSSYTASDMHPGDVHEQQQQQQQQQQRRRPFSAREGFQERNIRDGLKESLDFEGKPYFTNVSEHRHSHERPRQRPLTCKERTSVSKDKEIPSVYKSRTPRSSNIMPVGSEYNVSNRQLTSKGSNVISILRTAGSKRPISSRRVNIRADDNTAKQPHCNNTSEPTKIPPIHKPRWMKDFVVKPSGTSQYSREILEQDFKKHRYIQEQMSQRGIPDARTKPPVPFDYPLKESTKASTDDDGSVALSCFSDGGSFTAVSRTPSPSPSPTLSPTPSPVMIQPIVISEPAAAAASTPSALTEVPAAEVPVTRPAASVRGGGRYDISMDMHFRDMLNPFAHLKKEFMMQFDIDPVSGNRTSDENAVEDKFEKKGRRRKVDKPDDSQDFFVPRAPEPESGVVAEPSPEPSPDEGIIRPADEPTLQYKLKKDFNMENYIPPSHVLKLAKAVENMSNSSRSDDSSENEITFVIKDGKQGKFILKDDTLIPARKPIFQKKRARKKSRHDKEMHDKENREVHYIDYDKKGDDAEEAEEEIEEVLDEHFVRKLCTAEEKRRKKKEEMKRGYSQFKETDRKVLAKKALAKIESANRELLGIKDLPKKDVRKIDEGRRELPKVEDGTTEADLVRRELGREEDAAVETSMEATTAEPPTEKSETGKEETKEDLGGKKDGEADEVSTTTRDKKLDDKQLEKEKKVGAEGKEEGEKEKEKCGADDDVVAETTVTEEETTQDEGTRGWRSEGSDDDEDRSDTEDMAVEGWGEDQDSDPDREIYLSKRVRCRPSSSIYDYLPPLNPDPVLDEGDANRCKARLQGDTVVIREALARNERADLETVVDVIIANNTNNRRWLRHLYRDEYLQSLLLDLRKTLPADIASVVSYMMIPICEFDAMCLWDALKGLHKDPEVLCEILCTRTNEELQAIKEAYLLRYGEDLLDHIEDETIGVFQRILIRLSEGEREVEEIWNKSDCAKEAKAIAALLEVKGAYLEKKLIDVFCTHSLEMLRSVLTEYRKHKGNDMDQDVVRIMKGNFCRAIVTILHYISNPPNYFVEKLHNSHFKGNDDDKSLCRIIISRAETDLDMIKMLFQLRYGMELHAYIDQVCHGALKGLALRLISANVKGDERMQLDFPPLWPGDEEIHLIQRLTLEDVIQIMIRKSKFLSKGQKIIALRREKQREAEEAAQSSDSGESDVEADVPEVMEERAQDSEEEEERAQKEAQRELRDGLKNISFADEVQVHEDGLGGECFKSVFADVSFAEASRGILKVAQDEDMKEESEATGVTKELQEEFGNVKSNWPKVTQLNGPVLDPTFSGRQEVKRKKILIQRSKRKAFRGTVCGISMDHFNALRDAQAIGKAMLQKNRNMEGIIQFLTTRNNAQRQLIIREFFRRYRRDLVDDLRVLTPMNEEIILSLLLSGEVYDAASLYSFYTSDNLVVTIDGLIEILLTRQNDEILIMKRAFTGIFGMDIGEVIEKKTRNHFTKLLLTVADGKRDQTSEHVDSYMAKKDAQSLYEAIIKKPTNYDLFIEIFALRSFAHIEAVCDHFPEIAQVDILEVLDSCLKGGFLEAIITIICMVRDTEMYFCERIYRAVSYEPQNFAMLIRLIIGRCELDLQVIKQTFRRTYGRTIYDIIEKETDFASKKILLSVIKR